MREKMIFKFLHHLMTNIVFQVLQMEARISSQTERVQYNDLQSLLCATLQSVLKKVEPEHAPLISDNIMQALLSMFQVRFPLCSYSLFS